MKRSILVLVSAGVVLTGVPGLASATESSAQVCNGTVSNLTINTDVWVPKGAVCKLTNVKVTGNVWAEEYGTVLLGDSTVGGNVEVKGGGYLNAYNSTAAFFNVNGSWGAYLKHVHAVEDLTISGPRVEEQGIRNPASWVRPNVYVQDSDLDRSIQIQNADLTLTGSRLKGVGRYGGKIDSRNAGSQHSSLTLTNDVMDGLYTSQAAVTVTGSTIGDVSIGADATTPGAPATAAQFGTPDGRSAANRFGTFSAYGTLSLGMWDNTVTGPADAALHAPSAVIGARNHFQGPVTGDLRRLQSGAAPGVRAMHSSTQVTTTVTHRRDTMTARARQASRRADAHGSAHLKGQARRAG